MNELFALPAAALDDSVALPEEMSLTFVDDAQCEFVSGGASVGNGY